MKTHDAFHSHDVGSDSLPYTKSDGALHFDNFSEHGISGSCVFDGFVGTGNVAGYVFHSFLLNG